jgi:hypothetical protein
MAECIQNAANSTFGQREIEAFQTSQMRKKPKIQQEWIVGTYQRAETTKYSQGAEEYMPAWYIRKRRREERQKEAQRKHVNTQV